MPMPYGVIGDAHLGFKAYDSTTRTEECTWCFKQAVKILYDKGIRVIFQVGDLIDDTTWPNWVEKSVHSIFNTYSDVKFIILGGNHDSTKTYTSVSALDVLEERPNITVCNNFAAEYGIISDITYLAIPHMKSQKEFKEVVLSVDKPVDICMLHSMILSNLDLGPNDLNIDQEMLDHLTKFCKKIYIGHQHSPVIMSEKIIIAGSTMELHFGELGPRYVYLSNGEIEPIPQPRLMERIDIAWSGVNDLLDRLHCLNDNCIYKVVVNGVPHSEYSVCVAGIDSLNFSGDLIYDIIKIGHTEVEISQIRPDFDLIEEFKQFSNEPGLIEYLEDAISELGDEDEY